MIDIEISVRVDIDVDRAQWTRVIESIASDAGFEHGSISIGVIDDSTMHQLNREHLDHDYPTDVLSFVFDRSENMLDGEVLVSSDTAEGRCAEFGLSRYQELLLYVIHGTLHLVGYDDKQESDRETMRQQESHYLGKLGIQPRVGIAERADATPRPNDRQVGAAKK